MDDDLESYWADVRVPWIPPPPEPGEIPEEGVLWVGLFQDSSLTVESTYERQKVEASSLGSIDIQFPTHTEGPATIYGAGLWSSRVKGHLVLKVAFSAPGSVASGHTLRTNLQVRL